MYVKCEGITKYLHLTQNEIMTIHVETRRIFKNGDVNS